MRRLLDPRRWSFETRVVTFGLAPLVLVAVLLVDSWDGRYWLFWALLAVRWLVVAPWARHRQTSRAVQPVD